MRDGKWEGLVYQTRIARGEIGHIEVIAHIEPYDKTTIPSGRLNGSSEAS